MTSSQRVPCPHSVPDMYPAMSKAFSGLLKPPQVFKVLECEEQGAREEDCTHLYGAAP